jgi:hypothetical protein
LGSARELLLHRFPEECATVLYDIDEQQVVERLKAIIEVKETEDATVKIEQEHIDKVKKYLLMLDLIVECSEKYESGRCSEYTVFTQPGMRYAIAKALVYSLLQDNYFCSVSERNKDYIISKILEDVKGRMLEDIVMLETHKSVSRCQDVFKYKFDNGGEYDMVIYDRSRHICRIYEIKHSTEVAERQLRYLKDDGMCSLIESRYGTIEGRYVLYRGEDRTIGDIQYLNVEKYLCNMK